MTAADLLAAAFVRANVAGSLAILLVLALRAPARRMIGAELAYALWAIVPFVAVAALFPTLSEFDDRTAAAAPSTGIAAPLLLQAWAAGALALSVLFCLSEARFRRLASRGRAGPAVMGVHWPRMITPIGYTERFTAPEQALIRRHELTHIARRDPKANLLIAMLQVLAWFNPLTHIAAACARLDQELACDAAVVEGRPESRRLYGATLLKAHMATPSSPLACGWISGARHPLETRLAMLARPPVSLPLYLRGAAAVALAGTIAVLCVWSTGPRWGNQPAFVWPMAQSVMAADLSP